METIAEALRLLKRQAAIQNDVRRARESRVVEERELFLIRNRLAQFPAAVQAITLDSQPSCTVPWIPSASATSRSALNQVRPDAPPCMTPSEDGSAVERPHHPSRAASPLCFPSPNRHPRHDRTSRTLLP